MDYTSMVFDRLINPTFLSTVVAIIGIVIITCAWFWCKVSLSRIQARITNPEAFKEPEPEYFTDPDDQAVRDIEEITQCDNNVAWAVFRYMKNWCRVNQPTTVNSTRD